MYPPILALDIQSLVSKFGLHTDVFIAHLIAFSIVVAVVVKFGIKPIQEQLEERRQRIIDGEEMRAESEKMLTDVKLTSDVIIKDAQELGQSELTNAKKIAQNHQEESAAKAITEAQDILSKARKQAELEAAQQKAALRGDFARLVAEATAQVTGKFLSEEDKREINASAIAQL